MSWFKKSQGIDGFQSAIVEDVLRKHVNGSPEDVRTELSLRGISDPCPVLETICNNGSVHPFYTTVWTYLCGTQQPPEQEEIIQNNI
jgi:hypothetical protein